MYKNHLKIEVNNKKAFIPLKYKGKRYVKYIKISHYLDSYRAKEYELYDIVPLIENKVRFMSELLDEIPKNISDIDIYVKSVIYSDSKEKDNSYSINNNEIEEIYKLYNSISRIKDILSRHNFSKRYNMLYEYCNTLYSNLLDMLNNMKTNLDIEGVFNLDKVNILQTLDDENELLKNYRKMTGEGIGNLGNYQNILSFIDYIEYEMRKFSSEYINIVEEYDIDTKRLLAIFSSEIGKTKRELRLENLVLGISTLGIIVSLFNQTFYIPIIVSAVGLLTIITTLMARVVTLEHLEGLENNLVNVKKI